MAPNKKEDWRALKVNQTLCNPPEGEDVVISGVAGKFPNSDDVYQFRDNLFAMDDMISYDDRRWKFIDASVPHGIGKVNSISKFDAGFFGVHQRFADKIDPMSRLLFERISEAIMDAGYHPSELAGTKTGVFISIIMSDSDKENLYAQQIERGHAIMGTRSFLPHLVSYYFQLRGPSILSDTACSSSFVSLEGAYKAIRSGRCDMAIVAGATLLLHPMSSQQFARVGVLSPDCSCKAFDENANGYVRSEAVCALLLCKSKQARRIYAHVLHIKTNSDGFKHNGIMTPSSDLQASIVKEVYQERNINPSEVSYFEGHGTGTQVGDLQELTMLSEIFVGSREKPLYIGSVKSNCGHTEGVSGLTSLVKIIVGMESGFIPPNRNFTQPRKDIEALLNGKLKVVTKKTAWPDENVIVAQNSVALGGVTGHALFRWNQKTKINDAAPEDDVPRLVCVSGRTEQAIEAILNDLGKRILDAEFVKLLHTVFGKTIEGHTYRGFTILDKTGELQRSLKRLEVVKPKLLLVFSDSDSSWSTVGRNLLSFGKFAETVDRIQSEMAKKIDINILRIITHFEEGNKMHEILITMVVQLFLIDILKTLNIVPDSVIGFGIGELMAAYHQEFLSLEEIVIEYIYAGLALNESKNYDFALACKNLNVAGKRDKKLSANLRKTNPSEGTKYKKWLHWNIENTVARNKEEDRGSHWFQNGIPGTALGGTMKWPTEESTVLVIGPKMKQLGNKTVIYFIQEDAFSLLNSMGRLYEIGYDMQLDKFYPKVEWPVSRGTPMISPLIKWNDEADWFSGAYEYEKGIKSKQRVLRINLEEDTWNFISGHIVNGIIIFPATGYLYLVWESLAKIYGKQVSDMRVVFENVKFVRATSVPPVGYIDMTILLQPGRKKFEITEAGAVLVTGQICDIDGTGQEIADLPISVYGSDVLTVEEIYKELKLRGYDFRDIFRGLKDGDVFGSKAFIPWVGNWITFMDSMLHMTILHMDARNLYVPSHIRQVIIDGPAHMRYISNLRADGNNIPVYGYKGLGLIRSGGIEYRDMTLSPIIRRKQASPVLEAVKFVPNKVCLDLDQSVRVMMQIVSESHFASKLKIVEVSQENGKELLCPFVKQAMAHMEQTQAEIKVLSNKFLKLPGINVSNGRLQLETNVHVVIASNLSENKTVLHTALNIIKDTDGFIITREAAEFEVSTLTHKEVQVLCVHTNSMEKLVLLRRLTEYKQPIVVDISSSSSSTEWLPIAQNAIEEGPRVIFISQNQCINGILGLFTTLRREPNDSEISCFNMIDHAPDFDVDHPFYRNQMRKRLGVNIWKDGRWGTYRHLLLEEPSSIFGKHCYVNVTARGDMSSMKWIQGPLGEQHVGETEEHLIRVYWSALNFKDVTIASARIIPDTVAQNYMEQECALGYEFSGRDLNGMRVMGFINHGALSTLVEADPDMLWLVPEKWSLEDAATVPTVYLTVIYALIVRASIKHGQSILIHSAAGGVGQAAINLAVHFGCTIFVTVGTQEKREFLRRTYPAIKDSHIGNSRDTSFEQMVQSETHGRGVDIVLSSLTGEKLQASVRCLATGGNYLEIGKVEMVNHKDLGLQLFAKQASLHGILLDAVTAGGRERKTELYQHLVDLIEKGVCKPLPRTVFQKNDILPAFKLMATGKHIGKVLLEIRKEGTEHFCRSSGDDFEGVPRFLCYPGYTYVIVGGLGGFGLQLADWLVTRGARKLILTSRTGLKTGYQVRRTSCWRSSGVEVVVRTDDVTTKEGCTDLIKYSNSLGPVKAVFNLAAILRDALFENQTEETFRMVFAPKVLVTQNLDAITRKMCPKLSHFVTFSSAVCRSGNAGQTNYSMANSIMERICEQRKVDGYPAVAIQWGVVGDVGIVAENKDIHDNTVIAGMLPQRISSCLQVLDRVLTQNETIVASFMVNDKSSSTEASKNVVTTVANILGVRDLKTISMHSTLADLGLDSIMSAQISSALEREFQLIFSVHDMIALTFDKLHAIDNTKTTTVISEGRPVNEEKFGDSARLLLRLGEMSSCAPVVKINTSEKSPKANEIFFLPGLEGTFDAMEALGKKLKAHVTCLQFCLTNRIDTIEEWAKAVFPFVEASSGDFVLVSHSFGCVVATELTSLLEKCGRRGKVVYIDGSPERIAEYYRRRCEAETEESLETSVICAFMDLYLPPDTVTEYKFDILNCGTFEDRIEFALSVCPNVKHSLGFVRDFCTEICRRIKAVLDYEPNFDKLRSEVTLIKSKEESENMDFADDFQLSSLFQNSIYVTEVDGEPSTILEMEEVARAINKFIEI